MNVLYAGTPTNSADILKFLALSKKINIKGVITQNNKIGKRGNKLIESPVAIEAKTHKIPVFMPTDLNEDEFKILQEVSKNCLKKMPRNPFSSI